MTTEAAGPTPAASFDSTTSAADDFVERILANTVTGAELRVALVTETENSGDYRVKTSATGSSFWCASLDASLRVGDRVLMLKQESAFVVVGRLSGGGSTVPIGVVNPYAGGVVPNGWLVCDGSAVSRSDYAALFAVIGTSYGGGNGSTTFNIPNLVNRFALGAGSRQRGATGGAESVTLSQAQMPSHNHYLDSGTTGTEPGGTATVQAGSGATVAGLARHSHQVTANTDSRGSGQAHENMPPFQVLPYIIKAR